MAYDPDLAGGPDEEVDGLVVYDPDGHPCRVPFRPTGEDRLALARRAATADALRPLEDLLRELQQAEHTMSELEAGLARRP